MAKPVNEHDFRRGAMIMLLKSPEGGARLLATSTLTGTTTTIYIGNYFEWTVSEAPTATMKAYYYAGATRGAGPQSTATPTATSTPEATPTTTGYLPGRGKALAMPRISPEARLELVALHAARIAQLSQTDSLTVTVQDSDGVAQAGLNVYAFDGATYTGFNGVTDANGNVTLSLPVGSYRFRADKNGTQFWSGTENHCSVPGCMEAAITTTIPLTVTVLDTNGIPQTGLPVYAFDGATYTGYNKTTNDLGEAVFTLPVGSYRFRADKNGTQFWSGETNHCTVPGCLEASISVPGTLPESMTTITYTYDVLYRLTGADYDDGRFFHYSYDATGNRLTEETRLGTTPYSYDHANRLVGFSGGGSMASFGYNGLGDRALQTVNNVTTNYAIDIATGLTQVLMDDEHIYLYGVERIVQHSAISTEYFGFAPQSLTDALGSVRQLADADGQVNLAQSYEPYGAICCRSKGRQASFACLGMRAMRLAQISAQSERR
jgi:hypothetical protein